MVVRHLTKADLDLELDELESAARMVADEVEMKKASRDKIVQGVVVSRDDSDDDDDESDDDSNDGGSTEDSSEDSTSSDSDGGSSTESEKSATDSGITEKSDEVEKLVSKLSLGSADGQAEHLSLDGDKSDHELETIEKRLTKIELASSDANPDPEIISNPAAVVSQL